MKSQSKPRKWLDPFCNSRRFNLSQLFILKVTGSYFDFERKLLRVKVQCNLGISGTTGW